MAKISWLEDMQQCYFEKGYEEGIRQSALTAISEGVSLETIARINDRTVDELNEIIKAGEPMKSL